MYISILTFKYIILINNKIINVLKCPDGYAHRIELTKYSRYLKYAQFYLMWILSVYKSTYKIYLIIDIGYAGFTSSLCSISNTFIYCFLKKSRKQNFEDLVKNPRPRVDRSYNDPLDLQGLTTLEHSLHALKGLFGPCQMPWLSPWKLWGLRPLENILDHEPLPISCHVW